MSLTEAQAREAVYQQFKTAWVVAHPTIPYYFENEASTEEPSAPWVRVALRTLDSVQHTLGAAPYRQFRRDAAVQVNLFAAVDDGMLTLGTLVDTVRGIFEGSAFGGIDPAGGVRVSTIGPKGRWYEVAVIVPVTYYETR